MVQKWSTVRVFISSTFRDMQAERDHLVRVIFPELRERCHKRHVHLVDVDLRWGVTEKQAEGGRALDICLDEIDSCRPFFLGLLGQRYGYIPPGQEHSITAQEVYHGVLHNNLPRQLIDLRPFVEGILEERILLREQVGCLVRCYQWDASRNKYLLIEHITREDEEMLHSIFGGYSLYQRDRSFFFFRSEAFSRELAGDKIEDYFETEEGNKEKLSKLKQEIEKAGMPCFEYYNLGTFGQRILDTLWQRIDAEFPEERAIQERDWLEEEAEFHELFITDRTRRFVGRRDLLARMHEFAEREPKPDTLVITGEPGCGKSALMAVFTQEVTRRNPDWLVLSHFVGASPSSTSLRSTLKRFCTHLSRTTGQTQEIPEEYKKLADLFPQLLDKAAKDRRILLIIDAVNQFEKADNPDSMTWLPLVLPDNVRVVLSTLAGDALDALWRRRAQPAFETVPKLTETEIRELVNQYLQEIRKQFPTEEISRAFFDKIKAGHPLYILVALEELRVFPLYEDLYQRIMELPENVPSLFSQVLERIEGDFGQPLVRDFMSYIACGRQGMTSQELQTLLKHHSQTADPVNTSQRLPDMIFSRLRRAFGAYLFERSGVIDFFHGQLKEAVGRHYLSEEIDRCKVHETIAEYFDRRWTEPYLRSLDELPHQMTKAKAWEGLERILCDLQFIEFKCGVGMTYDLIHDYEIALDSLPEAQLKKQERLRQETRVKKYVSDLIAYVKGEIAHFDIIPSVEPWEPEKMEEDFERITKNPSRLDRIRAFSQFVNLDIDSLSKYAYLAGFVLQQAYNFANAGPVITAAELNVNTRIGDIMLLRHPHQRPDYNPHPAIVRNFHQPAAVAVSCVCVTFDGKKAVSGGRDGNLRMWDLDTGQCLRILRGVDGSGLKSVSVTPDGKTAVSGGRHILQMWDLESGQSLRVLRGHTGTVNSVMLTPDRRRALSGSGSEIFKLFNVNIFPNESADHTVRVWDLESGQCLNTLMGHTDIIWSIGLTPDGKRAVSASQDSTLRVWDLESGQCLYTLTGHTDSVCSVDVAPDGKRAVSGSADKTLRIWDLENGQCVGTLVGHTSGLTCVKLTADGRRAVSASYDETLRVWNLESTQCIRILYGHKSSIEGQGLSLTADGRRAVSVSTDTLRVWDLESGQSLGTFVGHVGRVASISLTADGRRAVSASHDKTLRVWDLESGQCLYTLTGHTDSVRSVDVAPDGKRAVSGSADKTLRIWDLENGQCLNTLIGHTNDVWIISLTPDGKRAVSASQDSTLRVWDLESGQCLNTLMGHTNIIWSIGLTPDGKRAVSASLDSTLRVWDLESGQCLRILKGHTSKVNKRTGHHLVHLTPDGKRAISASDESTLQVWDLESGQCLYTLMAHTGGVYGVDVTPDGKKVVSTSDKTLLVWDLESGNCLAALNENSGFSTLTIGENGFLVYGTRNGEVLSVTCRGLDIKFVTATPIRVWLHGETGGSAFRWLTKSQKSGGCWDTAITSTCFWCGRRFRVAKEILVLISNINRKSNLSLDQSPCLNLPKEAWECQQLSSECPLCHKPLKFNPFIVDNRGRY